MLPGGKMSQKPNYPLRFILTWIFATIIFVDIFLISYGVSYLNYQSVVAGNNLVKTYLNDLDSYLKELNCSNDVLIASSERLDATGANLALLETNFGKGDPRVLEQKKLYSNLEDKHLQIAVKFNELCNSNFVPILFFYSNEGDLEKESESMGFIVSSFKGIEPQRFMIYSFDYNLDSSVVKNLKAMYNISSAPLVVTNFNETIYVRNINDLSSRIKL